MLDFNYEDLSEQLTLDTLYYANWFKQVCEIENRILGSISIIFCSDNYLLKINQTYLQHDYYTDIITFNYNEPPSILGDLFVSIDRVKENAQLNQVDFFHELNRVMVHGILHLCDYNDKTPEEEKKMRLKENQMLNLLK